MTEPTYKTRTIATVADLLDVVTLDNSKTLGIAIADWLTQAAIVKDIIIKAGGKLGNDAQTNSFEWTDDNSNSVNVEVHLITTESNETTRD